jgi:hypothetical protein
MDDTQGRTPPVQIPAPVEGFVSREAALDVLDRTWRRRVDRPPIVVLSGIGGVGKTTVAVRWLSDHRGRFPGGLLYARLSEPGGDPVPTSEILFGFLVAIGVPADTIPPQPGQRSAVFRAAVDGRFVGILLDDAVSAGQVRALLPATASAMVVVTSRRQLGGLAMDGAELLDLAPLTADDSRRLLGEAAGPERVAAEPDAAGTIVEICGGLPLALGIIGARLRARPLRSLAREASAYARHLGAGSAAPTTRVRCRRSSTRRTPHCQTEPRGCTALAVCIPARTFRSTRSPTFSASPPPTSKTPSTRSCRRTSSPTPRMTA